MPVLKTTDGVVDLAEPEIANKETCNQTLRGFGTTHSILLARAHAPCPNQIEGMVSKR
jgi:hypothetical protein